MGNKVLESALRVLFCLQQRAGADEAAQRAIPSPFWGAQQQQPELSPSAAACIAAGDQLLSLLGPGHLDRLRPSDLCPWESLDGP